MEDNDKSKEIDSTYPRQTGLTGISNFKKNIKVLSKFLSSKVDNIPIIGHNVYDIFNNTSGQKFMWKQDTWNWWEVQWLFLEGY